MFLCFPWCSSVFASRIAIVHHVTNMFKTKRCNVDRAYGIHEPIEPTTLNCAVCDFEAEVLAQLHWHCRTHHPGPEYLCNLEVRNIVSSWYSSTRRVQLCTRQVVSTETVLYKYCTSTVLVPVPYLPVYFLYTVSTGFRVLVRYVLEYRNCKYTYCTSTVQVLCTSTGYVL